MQVWYPVTNQTGTGRASTVYTYAYDGGPIKNVQAYDESNGASLSDHTQLGVMVRQTSRAAGPEDETKGQTGSSEQVGLAYDPLYRLKTLSDGKGNPHTHVYDNVGNLTRFTFPGGTSNAAGGTDTVTGSYDPDHNLTDLLDGLNRTIHLNLATDDSRVQSVQYNVPAGVVGALSTLTPTYDSYGRVTSLRVGDPNPNDPAHRLNLHDDGGGDYSYTYDDGDRLTSETVSYYAYTDATSDHFLPVLTLSYTYNNDGSRATLTMPALGGGSTFAYTYDNGGRLKKVLFPWGGTVANSYFANDWLFTQSANQNATTPLTQALYRYNALGQLTYLNNTASGNQASLFGVDSSNAASTPFTYDGAGNLTSYFATIPTVVNPNNNQLYAPNLVGKLAFTYDNTTTGGDRLTGEMSNRASSNAATTGPTRYLTPYANSFASDDADNLTTLRGGAMTYNADNQFSNPTHPSNPAFKYDGDGCPTTYNNLTLTYDLLDRLTSYGSAFTAGYRADGLRAWKQVGSARTYYLYDGGHVLCEINGATGAATIGYGWGAGGLAERYEAAGGLTYAYTFDPQGNVVQRHRLPSSQVAYADYTTLFDAFGAQRSIVSSSGQQIPSDNVGFAGQWGAYTDQETAPFNDGAGGPVVRYALVLMGLRYYEPQGARFLTRDPIGSEGGVNLYAYTRNNPVNAVDPLGLQGPGGDDDDPNVETLIDADGRARPYRKAMRQVNKVATAANNVLVAGADQIPGMGLIKAGTGKDNNGKHLTRGQRVKEGAMGIATLIPVDRIGMVGGKLLLQ